MNTDPPAFSRATLTALKRAGWRPGRKVFTKHWASLLSNASHPVHPVVLEFLEAFGALSVSLDNESILFSLNPSHALKLAPWLEGGDGMLEEVNAWVNHRLCLIGISFETEEPAPLLMAENGHVFGLYDGYLWRLGETGESAIERLCSGHGDATT